MKVMIIDRDEAASHLIKSRLESQGFSVGLEPSKNTAVDRLAADPGIALVFLDPAPLSNARQMVLSMRRAVRHYLYVVLMGNDIDLSTAIQAGANDVLLKPFEPAESEKSGENARTLSDLVKRLGNTDEDFPSAGGVIAKSAFNQLFLSAIDRADRYGERSYVLLIGLHNHTQIKVNDTPDAADYVSAHLAKTLSRIRRQSDILAQTGAQEYALLLQRPIYETEPVEAANRFADTLNQTPEIASETRVSVEITVRLVEIPTGKQMIEHIVTLPGARV